MSDTLHVCPWPDRIIDTLGHDPRSWYAETFWLPTLGPTCLLLMRRFADGFDRNPEGFVVASGAIAAALGVGDKSAATAGGQLRKALRRLEQFSLATTGADGAVLVRRNFAPIHRKHIRRLPPAVRSLHHEISEEQLLRPLNDTAIAHARRTALTYIAEGESPDCTERALLRIGYPPTVTRSAVAWATQRNVEAARTTQEPTPAA